MTTQEAEEYFKDRNVAHEVYADIWTEDTINSIAAITDAFHSGKTLKDISDITKQIDLYIIQLNKAQQTERTRGAKDAFLIVKKLLD